jgi:hypothetical protein
MYKRLLQPPKDQTVSKLYPAYSIRSLPAPLFTHQSWQQQTPTPLLLLLGCRQKFPLHFLRVREIKKEKEKRPGQPIQIPQGGSYSSVALLLLLLLSLSLSLSGE